MNGTDTIDRRSETERVYDTEIAPALWAITQRCMALRIPIVARVEYAPGGHGDTCYLPEGASLEMNMLNYLMRTAPNIDGFILGLAKYAKETGLDTSSSIVMTRLAGGLQ